MPSNIADILVFIALLGGFAVMGWIGQWGRTNTFARYFVLAGIGFSALIMVGFAGLTLLASRMPGGNSIPYGDVLPWLFAGIGASAVPSLIPPVRRFLAKTVFPGLDAAVPAHTWALYVFLASVITTSTLITAMYDPDSIVESLKGTPIVLMAVVNVVSFVLFAFVASGIWIYKPFKAVVADLGLTGLPWATVGKLVGFSLLLALGIQAIEWVLLPLVSVDMKEALERVVDALKPQGGPMFTVFAAIVVGLSAGIGEEVLFRGLIQPLFGVVATAILFTLIHIHYGPTVLLLELFLIGLVLGYIRNRWNTTAAIIVHGGFDFFALTSHLWLPNF